MDSASLIDGFYFEMMRFLSKIFKIKDQQSPCK